MMRRLMWAQERTERIATKPGVCWERSLVPVKYDMQHATREQTLLDLSRLHRLHTVLNTSLQLFTQSYLGLFQLLSIQIIKG